MLKGPLVRLSQRLYGLLLRIYPRVYRDRFAEPMCTAFDERCAEQIGGVWSAVRVWAHEFPSLVDRGLRERLGLERRSARPQPTERRPRMDRVRAAFGALSQDAAHAVRMLRGRPTYTLIVLSTLVLGIGMNTAVFSVLYGVLLQPLPFAAPERLVRIGRASPDSDAWLNPISPAEFRDFEARLELFESVAAVAPSGGILTDSDLAAFVSGGIVTPELFDMLGVPPQTGRYFEPADFAPDAAPVIVLSDAFWRNRRGADAGVLGSTVELRGTDYTVIGVAPAGFAFRPGYGLSGAEFWEPLRWSEGTLGSRHNHYLMVYARLADGVSLEAAADEVAAVWGDVVSVDPGNHLDEEYEIGLRAVPLRQFNLITSRDPLVFLAGAVGLILLISCANVVNLLLGNAESRQHELAVRAAIGAGRRRLMRQFLTESLIVVGTGGVLGVAAAALAVRAVLAVFPDAVPRSAEVGLHLPVLAFAVAISLLTALVLGLATALQVDVENPELRAGRHRTGRRSVFRKGLIVGEVMLALMLVIGAGLMLKSYWKVRNIDLGFASENLLAINVTLPAERYQNREQYTSYYEALAEVLAARPGVAGVGMINMVPIRSFGTNISGVHAVGRPERRASFVEVRSVDSGYHATLGVPLVRGRGFTAADLDGDRRVVIINQELARQLFGDEDPVGQRLALEPAAEIIGVVGDIKALGPDREIAPHLFFPVPYASDIVVRLHANVEEFIPHVHGLVRQIDAGARVWRIETMDSIVADALGDRRFQIVLVATFALVAMVLGAIGTYGVMAYTIEAQMREFGIRVAVGASARDIHMLVLGGAGTLAITGLALGLAGAYALRRFVASLLVEVEAWDPAVYGGVTLAMAAVALLACSIPARRAARVDPVEILRRD